MGSFPSDRTVLAPAPQLKIGFHWGWEPETIYNPPEPERSFGFASFTWPSSNNFSNMKPTLFSSTDFELFCERSQVEITLRPYFPCSSSFLPGISGGVYLRNSFLLKITLGTSKNASHNSYNSCLLWALWAVKCLRWCLELACIKMLWMKWCCCSLYFLMLSQAQNPGLCLGI